MKDFLDVFNQAKERVNFKLPTSWLEKLQVCYSEPHRTYHTISHVTNLLSLLISHVHSTQFPHLVFLAICFHDAVYDTNAKDNEVKSVELFHETAGCDIDTTDRDVVDAMILSTINHHPLPVNASYQRDLELFLDFDLQVLTWTWDTYEAYSRQIRIEYAQFGDEKFREGRMGVLKRFLARDRLFFCMSDWEASARANLERELSQWN